MTPDPTARCSNPHCNHFFLALGHPVAHRHWGAEEGANVKGHRLFVTASNTWEEAKIDSVVEIRGTVEAVWSSPEFLTWQLERRIAQKAGTSPKTKQTHPRPIQKTKGCAPQWRREMRGINTIFGRAESSATGLRGVYRGRRVLNQTHWWFERQLDICGTCHMKPGVDLCSRRVGWLTVK